MTQAMDLGLGATRAQLVEALRITTTGVDGAPVALTPTPTTPRTPQPYDAWVVNVDSRPITMCTAEADWHVFVALPAADQDTTVTAGDLVANDVCDALMQLAKVTHVRPMRWPVADDAAIPVWQFEITI